MPYRVGVHTDEVVCESVNRMPSLARRSQCGVGALPPAWERSP